MRQFRLSPFALLAALTFATLAAAPSYAQWQWIDRHGRPVFSDRPPPPDVPERDIRRQPGQGARFEPAPAAAPSAAATPRATASAPSGEDKALSAKAQQAAAAEAAKRQADEARMARMQAESCDRARQSKSGLSAGGRVARTNAQGEREFLDEAGIAAEMQRVDAIIAADCK